MHMICIAIYSISVSASFTRNTERTLHKLALKILCINFNFFLPFTLPVVQA